MADFIDLAGRVAIVTGGAQGIGQAVAELLARAGAAVGVIDRNGELAEAVAREIEASGGKAAGFAVDVANELEVAAVWEKVATRFGGLDILVSAAGVISPNVPADQAEMSDFERVIAVNLKGVLLAAKHAHPYMKKAGGGSIVNLSSQAALLSLPNQAIYTASKGGVTALTRSLAIDWAKERETFRTKLADKQAIQWMIADSEMELRAARLLTWQAAWIADLGRGDLKVASSIAKVTATETAGRVVDRAIQILGGLGVSQELPLERWYRELRIKRIGEGPSEVHRMVLARQLLGTR